MGLTATLLNGTLYFTKEIYADMGLECFYFISMCYGWHQWQKDTTSQTKTTLTLKFLSFKQWFILGIAFGMIFLIIHYILKNYTHSNIVALDAITTTFSLLAQWLMCHKIIITWFFWFITDAIYAWMYLTKNLPFHTVLMLIYTGMAITGYLYWLRKARIEFYRSTTTF